MDKYKKIYEQVKDSDNILDFVQDRKRQLLEENYTQYKGSFWAKGKKVGPNEHVGGQTSACSEFLEENRIVMVDSSLESTMIKTGNIDNVYVWLFKALLLNDMDNCNVEQLMNAVSISCDSYFGSNYDYNGRMKILGAYDICELGMFRGKNVAECVERAMFCHNMFKMLGLDATLKHSEIFYNGKNSIHAYNLLRVDGKNFIFDTSMANKDENGRKHPIVGSLTDEEYMLMIDGRKRIGCCTETMNNGVVYNSSFKSCGQELVDLPQEKYEEVISYVHDADSVNPFFSESKDKVSDLRMSK